MKPLIGVVGIELLKVGKTEVNTYSNKKETCDFITKSGGAIVQIPLSNDKKSLDRIFDTLDGLLIEGGEHVYPKHYNSKVDSNLRMRYFNLQRDKVELYLTKKAVESKKPVLALCRGMQLFNVALGGTLTQYLPDELENTHAKPLPAVARSEAAHSIKVTKDSNLSKIINKASFNVNSRHSQCINVLANKLFVGAKSEDGIIEAIELRNQFGLGTQWHPEDMQAGESKSIFQAFVNAAAEYNKNSAI